MNVIPLSRPDSEARAVEREVRTAFEAILRRGVFRWGPEAERLEQELGAFLGARHVVAVTSGGVALTIALRTLGVGAGDEVVMASNVDISIAAPVTHTGANIVWCDVDEATLTLDPYALERTLTSRARAVVVVHLFGNPADMDALRAVAAGGGVPIVEDASHAPGAEWRGQRCGTLGDVGILSLSSGKPLGAAGTAGAIVADAELGERARVLANYGLHPDDLQAIRRGRNAAGFRCVADGWNAALDEWQSAVLRAKLRHLPDWVARRRAQCATYRDRLERLLPGQAAHGHARPVPRHFVVRSPQRDRLVGALARRGVSAGIGYWPPLHGQPLYRRRGSCELPRTERAAAQLVTLPVDPFLSADEVHYVADSVAALGGNSA